MYIYCTVYWYGGARTAADRMCAVARYNDISKADWRNHIFIRAAAGQMCPKQDFIVVLPASNIMEVKQKNTIGVKKNYFNKIKINKSIVNVLFTTYTTVALDRPMAVKQLSDWFYGLKHSEITQKKIKQFYYENQF